MNALVYVWLVALTVGFAGLALVLASAAIAQRDAERREQLRRRITRQFPASPLPYGPVAVVGHGRSRTTHLGRVSPDGASAPKPAPVLTLSDRIAAREHAAS